MITKGRPLRTSNAIDEFTDEWNETLLNSNSFQLRAAVGLYIFARSALQTAYSRVNMFTSCSLSLVPQLTGEMKLGKHTDAPSRTSTGVKLSVT